MGISLENSAVRGGAIAATRSTVTLITKHVHFTGNRAEERGGAYDGTGGLIELGKWNHYFINNSAGRDEGVISHKFGRLHIAENSSFEGNSVRFQGGA